jgi:SAM-dependent methyltransferase
VDPVRFSTIAHAQHDVCNPLDVARLDEAGEPLDLAPGSRVIDVGCGKAEFLIRLAERFGVHGIGLDSNPDFIAAASERAARRGVAHRIALLEMDAACFDVGGTAFDAALCIGAVHALGGYAPALGTLAGWVRPGGRVLVGTGYWRRDPPADYLALLGARRDEQGSHEDNLAAGRAAGLVPLHAWASSEADWDRYEDLYAATALAFAAAHPGDPDAAAIRARAESWRGGYLRWGRDTLGFGLYLFGRPPE